jgi:hypothetical protein
MKKYRLRQPLILLILILAASLFLGACASTGKPPDPGDWGFDCLVTYNALGGVVNNREVRETYYIKNSYIFEPSGSTNMLIEPIRDGYILVGWYTDMEEVKAEDGSVSYQFKAEDRWDFDTDRVEEDMTLYARWIPQGQVKYIDPETDEIKFSKDITGNDAVQPLTSAAEALIAKPGMTFDGYYANPELTIPFTFGDFEFQEPILSKEEIYAQLFELFPDYFEEIEYEEPEEDEETEYDTSDLFINKLGYALTTEDETALAEIRAAKDAIYEETIDYYLENAGNRTIYLKYTDGRYIQISRASDLKALGKTGFLGIDKTGNEIDGYIITKDIDFAGESLAMPESFSGKIVGNGYTLKNIRLKSKSKKMDQDTHKDLALFYELNGAEIENINFEDAVVELDVKSGISVDAAFLAIKSTDTTLSNVKFTNLTITSGKGDDGQALYQLGDLFVEESGTKADGVSGENIEITASDAALINRFLDVTQ